MSSKKIELLAPAGDLERLKTAVLYGADAVFVGGKKFSLRSRASNFDLDSIREGAKFAHLHNSRLHVTVNIIPHEDDFEGLSQYLIELEKAGVDAIIVASLSVVKLAKKVAPKLEVHISTQYSITNSKTVDFYRDLGADRCVLARETSLSELELLSKNTSMPLEVFIHGGMCVNYSGRCTLSNYMTGRDANRGGCAQSCRWRYHLYDNGVEVSSPDCLFTMSSKDLNAIEVLPNLIDLGVASLKIEGRMKTDYYIANVVGAYRKAIDLIYEGKVSRQQIISDTNHALKNAMSRATFSGFYLAKPNNQGHLYSVNGSGVLQNFVANVLEYNKETNMAKIIVKNHFNIDDNLEIMSPKGISPEFKPKILIDSNNDKVSRLYKPMEICYMYVPFEVYKDDYVRKVMTNE